MVLEAYVEKGGQRLRLGYTTGTCAAAAAKAAARMLLTGQVVPRVRLRTPGGTDLVLEVEEIRFLYAEDSSLQTVSCAVRKDSGDDPDITNHILIRAAVSRSASPGVEIEGGEGVGRVTKPGLDQPVGKAAINSTPRRMIEEAVLEEAGTCAEPLRISGFTVVISVPQGEALAAKTFNPKLGIEGGISILGTTGIVEPMSDRALLDTIRAEISVRRHEGRTILAAAPGNYGKSFFLQQYRFSIDTAVTSSNFIYDTVCLAAEAGFRHMLFVGHIGKLVKVAGGFRNTHSKYGDHRMEILAQIVQEILEGPLAQIPQENLKEASESSLRAALMECVTTDEAVRILRERGLDGPVLAEMTRRIQAVMQAWTDGEMQVEVIVFSNLYGELGRTKGALDYIRRLREETRDAI